MTLEEKSKAIEEYCKEHRDKCLPGGCPLHDIENSEITCFVEYENYPDIVSENYEILFGKEKESECDPVNHPEHYTHGDIECIDAMKAAFGADELKIYCKIAAFKYLWRSEHKGGDQDIGKAVWYLNKYTELAAE